MALVIFRALEAFIQCALLFGIMNALQYGCRRSAYGHALPRLCSPYVLRIAALLPASAPATSRGSWCPVPAGNAHGLICTACRFGNSQAVFCAIGTGRLALYCRSLHLHCRKCLARPLVSVPTTRGANRFAMSIACQAFRGSLLHCWRDPGDARDSTAVEYIADGVMLVRAGRVERVGPASQLLPELGDGIALTDYTGKLLVPGLVDTHIHYVQTDIIAAYGEQLLTWLEKYTFPAERAFAEREHADRVARFFVDELLRNGTTTALTLGSVHAHSADAVFAAARASGMRLAAGKVLMDRNCPDYLQDTAATGYAQSRDLIERWHGVERLLYAITPRFAPTSTPAQLTRAGDLAREYPDVFVHTHLAENRAEVAWAGELFPQARSYLDVYDRYGLLRERSVLAHSIHLDDTDRERIAATGAAIASCPTCNLFIGSGLFDLAAADAAGIRVGLGTDVGGGTSFSMLQVVNEAYKVAQLRGQRLAPFRALYLATLGGARALYLDDRIGNFAAGKEADFVVLDPAATPLLARRSSQCRDIAEQLFALLILGDDRVVAATHLEGRLAHRRRNDISFQRGSSTSRREVNTLPAR